MSRTREILSNACKFHESAITLPMDNKHPASITSFGSGRGAFLFQFALIIANSARILYSESG